MFYEKNKNEDIIKILMLENSEQNKMTGKADCQVAVTKDQNILCSYI